MKTTLRGAEFHWIESGTGPALVFLHGLPFHKGLWAHQVAGFSRHHRAIAPDLRGFGESGLPAGEPSVDAYADDVAALLDFLGTGPVVLAGHSMGGYAALALARRRPDLLRGMVMVASRATADTADAAANRRSVAARLRTESPEFVAETMAPRMVATNAQNPAHIAAARALMDPLRADGIAHAQLALAARPDSTPFLGAVPCPVLVVAGERDAVVPLEESGIFAAGFRQGRLEVVEGAGHLPSWERPREFDAILGKWLGTL
jgi:pimeloyl-ACP methyl ester carboxylesterase